MMSALKPRIIYTSGAGIPETKPRIPVSVEIRNCPMGVRRIEVVSAPSPGHSYESGDSDSDESGSSGGGGGQVVVGGEGTRKRHRLTNLTPEEKMMRRKLKNRVAAQTARDRKKLRMSELEEALAAMEAENRRLLAENALLKKSSGTLSAENQALKQRLVPPHPSTPPTLPPSASRVIATPRRRITPGFKSTPECNTPVSVAAKESSSPVNRGQTGPIPAPIRLVPVQDGLVPALNNLVSVASNLVPGSPVSLVQAESTVAVVTGRSSESKRESAVLTSGPQQKELFARTIVALMTVHCIASLMLALSVTHCLSFWTGSTLTSSSTAPAPSSSLTTSRPFPTTPLPGLALAPAPPFNNPVLPPWWGAHQRNWNPSMDS